jgi:hypothetical protein
MRLGKRRYPFGRSKSAPDALAVSYGPAADACNAAANVRCCAGFRTPAMRSQPQARRPASEKGQGTKSQGSGAPSGVDAERCCRRGGTMFRVAAGREGLDDDHAAAAAAAGTRRHVGFVRGCGLGRLGLLRAGRHGEQLARSRDIGGAIAIGEQSVMADAVQALGQHVHQKAPNELVATMASCRASMRRSNPASPKTERMPSIKLTVRSPCVSGNRA